MKYKRYQGEFISRENNLFRIELWQESEINFQTETLIFPADSPLVIEWAEPETKVTPVRTSAATLRIISDSDRRFLDLYQIRPAAVRLDIYKIPAPENTPENTPESTSESTSESTPENNPESTSESTSGNNSGNTSENTPESSSGNNPESTSESTPESSSGNNPESTPESNPETLYWSGTLDTEFYEEPYAYEKDYIVELTFSDFAILDRIKWTQGQSMILIDMLKQTIEASQINANTQIYNNSYTYTEKGRAEFFCSFTPDNFFDEENEPMTCMQVLNTILQPFAFSIIQKAGKIYLYDLNTLSAKKTTPIRWTSTDARLAIDKTFNNIKITFSPYMKDNLIDISIDPSEITYDISQAPPTTSDNYDTAHPDGHFLVRTGKNTADALPGFTFVYQRKTRWDYTGTHTLFRIDPHFSTQSLAGFVLYAQKPIYYDTDNKVSYYPWIDHVAQKWTNLAPVRIIPKANDWLFINPYIRENYLLRLSAGLLFSVITNPFEEISNHNDKALTETPWYNQFRRLYLAFRLRLRDINNNVIYHYENYRIIQSAGGGMLDDNPIPQYGYWSPGDYTGTPSELYAQNNYAAYMSYYATGSPGKTPLNDFSKNYKENSHMYPNLMGVNSFMPSFYKMFPDAELIPMPPISGRLELQILSQLVPTTVGYSGNISQGYYENGHYKPSDGNHHGDFSAKFILINNINLSLRDKHYRELPNIDIETNTFVEHEAMEELQIDTFAGTLNNPHPIARGQILIGNSILKNATRAGHTDTLEKLLAGTVYSQYKGRKKVLQGTVRTVSDLQTFTDQADPLAIYIMAAETEDTISDQSIIKLIEIQPDEYTGIVYS
jgi:hypothetical protein